MKKFFISLFIVLLFAIFFLNIGKSFYAETFEVIETDLENDIVYIKNSSGFVYSFYGVEDWQEKDFCACIMFDNFTKNIFDDEIISVKYQGIFLWYFFMKKFHSFLKMNENKE